MYPARPAPTPSLELQVLGARPLRDVEAVITFANGEVHRFRTKFALERHPLRLGFTVELSAELVDGTGAKVGSVWFSKTVRDNDPTEDELLLGPASVSLNFGSDSSDYSLTCKLRPSSKE